MSFYTRRLWNYSNEEWFGKLEIFFNVLLMFQAKSVFSWYEGILTAAEPFVGRINLVDQEGYGKGSVNLTSIRESDHGWYQCRVLFPNRHPSSRNNGTWFYLTVTGKENIDILQKIIYIYQFFIFY